LLDLDPVRRPGGQPVKPPSPEAVETYTLSGERAARRYELAVRMEEPLQRRSPMRLAA
jgi:hypothetical protein